MTSNNHADVSPPKGVGIWVRVSTEDQAKGDSPEHHERRARAYAESREWEVAAVYRLAGVSGKSVREHPEALRMMEDIRHGRISALLFSKLARLARNTRELLDFADFFRAQKADLVSLQESIDTSTPAGRLFFTVLAALTQFEREEIADRTAASIKVRAQMGKSLGGGSVFGYRWEGKHLVPHPSEAPIRRLIYELFLETRRQKAVAQILNERGYRTRRGLPFNGMAVRRLLEDPTAKGLRRANYTCEVDGGTRRKPEEEWIHVPVEAVVSEEVWNQANAILAEQRQGRRPRLGRRPAHLFAGLAHCACGAKMYVPSNNPKYVCRNRKCLNKIPVEDLEAVFFDQLRGFLGSPEAISELVGGCEDGLGEKQTLLAQLEVEQRKIRQEMDDLFRLHSAGEIPTQGFNRRYQPLDDRLCQLQNEVPRLQGELDSLKVQLLSRDEALTDAKQLCVSLQALEAAEKRALTEGLTERIVIGKGEVSLHLYYLPFGTHPTSHSVEDVATRAQTTSVS